MFDHKAIADHLNEYGFQGSWDDKINAPIDKMIGHLLVECKPYLVGCLVNSILQAAVKRGVVEIVCEVLNSSEGEKCHVITDKTLEGNDMDVIPCHAPDIDGGRLMTGVDIILPTKGNGKPIGIHAGFAIIANPDGED